MFAAPQWEETTNYITETYFKSGMRLLTVFDLLKLQLFEIGTLRETQRIKGTTWVLPFLGIRLAISLGFGEGDGKEFNCQDHREIAPWNWVAEVGSLATWCSCPLLGRHPVAVTEGLRDQHSGLNKKDLGQYQEVHEGHEGLNVTIVLGTSEISI